MTAYGSKEAYDNPSPFQYEARKLQSSLHLQTLGDPAAWLEQIRCRALLRALFRNTKSSIYMLDS